MGGKSRWGCACSHSLTAKQLPLGDRPNAPTSGTNSCPCVREMSGRSPFWRETSKHKGAVREQEAPRIFTKRACLRACPLPCCRLGISDKYKSHMKRRQKSHQLLLHMAEPIAGTGLGLQPRQARGYSSRCRRATPACTASARKEKSEVTSV